MKAAVFKQAGVPLVIEEVVDPEPGPDDLIIKVKACGICGTDLHWSQGIDSTAGWRDLLPNAVMGHEFSGSEVHVAVCVKAFRIFPNDDQIECFF